MKVLKIVLISFGVLVAVLIAAAVIFIKTFDANRFKPQILAQAKTALNRDVNFDKVRLDIGLRGVSLKLNDLTLADDPAFQKGNFAEIKEVAVVVDVLAYLSGKTVSVPVVYINEPKIVLIRSKEGVLNAQTIVPAAPAAAPAAEEKPMPEAGLLLPSAYAQAASPASAAAPALPAIQVNSFKIVNGTVSYIDRSFEPALAVDVKKLDVNVTKFSLTDAFPFTVGSSVFSAKQNIAVNGTVKLDMKTNEVFVSGLTLATELADLDMAQIPAALPMAKDVSLPTILKGKLEVSVPNVSAGPKGLGALKATLALNNGMVAMKELAVPAKDITVTAQATEKDVTLEKASLGLGQGTVSASGKVEDYLSTQKYALTADVKGLNIEEVLNQEKAAVKAQGQLGAAINCSGTGFTEDALKSNLSGAIAADILKAKLKDLNVLRVVQDKINVIPGLSQSVEAGLPQKYKDALSAKDTSFVDMKLPVNIEDGEIVIKDTAIASDLFMFKGSCRSSLAGKYALEGYLLIPQEVSASMAASDPKLKYLFNGDQLISFPLKINGSASAGPQFTVDLEYIAEKLLVEQGTQELFRAIDKATGSSSDAEAVKGAVNDLLGNIFKK